MTTQPHPAVERLRGGLIVSCQATSTDILSGPDHMALMARSAELGGAFGIRANGVTDIAAIRRAVSLPIIGIFKQDLPDLGVRITPSLEAARAIVQAGADIVALDATRRGAEEGRLAAADFIRLVKAELGVPVMADTATFEEAVAAAEAGADIVATTLSGYTAYSPPAKLPDFALVEALVKALQSPVISEGRISTPAEARRILDLGAYAVVVGSMITRPRWIVQHYVEALRPAAMDSASHPVIAVDIGGTKISAAMSPQPPALVHHREVPTQASEGGQAVLNRVATLIEQTLAAAKGQYEIKAIGISTAGQPDSLGRIAFATGTLPGWMGLDVQGQLESRFGLPVAIENDGQMATLAEAQYGAGLGYQSVLCLTLGTGLGAGFAVNGQLYHGERGAGPTLGHIPVENQGRQCTCGQRGCLEQYVNSAALVDEYNALVPETRQVATGAAVIQAANDGDEYAARALDTIGKWLGYGLGIAVNLFDPSIVVIGGGLSQAGDCLLEPTRRSLGTYLYPAIPERPVVTAKFGSNAGLVGAAANAQQLLVKQ